MRILNVTAQKPNSTGSGTYLSELVNEFDALGHEQIVLAGIVVEDKIQFPEKVKFVPVYYNTKNLPFPVLGMSDSMPYISTRYKDLTSIMLTQFETTFINKVSTVISNFKPDLIICHHLYFLTAIIREHFPKERIVGICHGTDLRQFQKIELQNERIRKNIGALDHVFALHHTQKEQISELFNIDLNQITVIGSGYNHKIFYNQYVKKNHQLKKIIYAGKICEKKGLLSLLRSLNSLALRSKQVNFELLLAGGYSDQAEYESIYNFAENCIFTVTFLGKLCQNELAEKFNECDIFVLPSFFEGLPLVIIEALACGLKVVATDLPGIQKWISENIPNHNVMFVTPPIIKDIDEPEQQSLALFEENLAVALQKKIEENSTVMIPNTNMAKWQEVCKKIIGL